MKSLASLLLIFATLAGSAAYAQDNPASSLSRAQVVAGLQVAKAAGQVSFGDLDYPPAISQSCTRTRAHVVAELQAAKAAGLVAFGELDEPVTLVAASTLTREQVHAEVTAAREDSQVAFGGEGYPDTGA